MISLVTGGAGFIGSNLVDGLLSIGHKVICIDSESADNEKFYWNSLATNLKIDVCDYEKIAPHFKNVDYVFHMAAESRIQNTINNPSKAVKVNSYGTCVVLQCSLEAGVKRLVFSSTSAIYGKNLTPNNEKQEPDCLNPYSVSKLNGEHLCKIYNNLFGMQTLVLRYFNVYGNRQPSKGIYAPVIGIFKRQKESGQNLTVVGDGSQRRDFVNVSDVVNANILAATKDLHNEYLGTPFNIGSGENISVLEIAESISNKIVFVPKREGEMKETLADISKAKKVLGWQPEISLSSYLNS